MTLPATKALIILATILGGLLAGLALDRSIVQLPAWQQVGPAAWATFTRAADLRRGLMLYPAQGLGALLFSVAGAAGIALSRNAARRAMLPAFIAAALAIAALGVTRYRVAPYMLSLRRIDGNPDALRQTLSMVSTWWTVKAALHLSTFLANVWSLVAVAGTK